MKGTATNNSRRYYRIREEADYWGYKQKQRVISQDICVAAKSGIAYIYVLSRIYGRKYFWHQNVMYDEFAWLIMTVLNSMIGFIGTSLQLQSIITDHDQWLPKTRSIPHWTTSVFSSAWLTWFWFTSRSLLHFRFPLVSTPQQNTQLSYDSLTTESISVRVTLRLTVSQSVCLGVEPRLGLMTRYSFFLENYCPVHMGRPLWREVGSVVCQS
jgi:hypothetical protein